MNPTTNIDQNAAVNLGLKDNQFILNPGITAGDALNSITVQPQPTSPLPVNIPGVQAVTPENGVPQLVENGGDTITVQPEPTSPLPMQLTMAAPIDDAPENGSLQDQTDQPTNGTLDLRVAGAAPKQPEEKTGKKRANISSITEKLMIMKQKQQRSSIDE